MTDTSSPLSAEKYSYTPTNPNTAPKPVTSDDEPLVVQVTPHASEPVRPQVTERSISRIVVEDFEADAGDYEVSYTVKGTREGHEDKQVVREPSVEAHDGHAPADD